MPPSLPELCILHREYHKNEQKEIEINDSVLCFLKIMSTYFLWQMDLEMLNDLSKLPAQALVSFRRWAHRRMSLLVAILWDSKDV